MKETPLSTQKVTFICHKCIQKCHLFVLLRYVVVLLIHVNVKTFKPFFTYPTVDWSIPIVL